jgi:hypothetical protein
MHLMLFARVFLGSYAKLRLIQKMSLCVLFVFLSYFKILIAFVAIKEIFLIAMMVVVE